MVGVKSVAPATKWKADEGGESQEKKPTRRGKKAKR